MSEAWIKQQRANKKALGSKRAYKAGSDFEEKLLWICEAYEKQGIATINKVDPPSKVVGKGSQTRIIYLENPFLDFVGVWTANQNRPLFLEAKSTSEARLPFNKEKGGITIKQMTALRRWDRAGAIAGVLWWHEEQIRVVGFHTIELAAAMGQKSLKWRDQRPTRRGPSHEIQWDFLAELRGDD